MNDKTRRPPPQPGQPGGGQAPNWRYFVWFLVAFLAAMYFIGSSRTTPVQHISYTEFKQQVREGHVASVVFQGNQVTGKYKSGYAGGTSGNGSSSSGSKGSGGSGGTTHNNSGGESGGQSSGSSSQPAHGSSSQEQSAQNQAQKPTDLLPGEQLARARAAEAHPQRFETTLPPVNDPQLLPLLEKHDVTVRAKSNQTSWWERLLVGVLPWLLLIGLFGYVGYRMQKRMMGGGDGQMGVFGFGKSRAKRFREARTGIGFNDVAGLENAKDDLKEIVDYLKQPGHYRAIGAKIPRGVLLMGPPGTGKTLLAKAVAGEAHVPFYSISGSEFIEMFVGVGASRVRDMFNSAKKESPAIIFIDELDSVGRARGAGLGGGHDEREQTLNQILSEMDGFSQQESVIVLAATNRPDVLDPALMRPGRFDRKVVFELPNKEARKRILRVHTRRIPLAEDVDFDVIAGRTVGFAGADIANLANEAALLAGRANKQKVDMAAFAEARDKIILGAPREGVLSDEDKELVAYHEGGHALMAWLLPEADPLDKVTIIPRGRALGATEQMPAEDRKNLKRSYLRDRITVMLGGRVAEQLVFGDVTTGAEQDLKQATQLARRMVCQWGMNSRLGAVTFRRGEDHVFLGREIAQQQDFSEATARIIDEEIRTLISELEGRARELMETNRGKLDVLARALMDHETMAANEVRELFATTEDGSQSGSEEGNAAPARAGQA